MVQCSPSPFILVVNKTGDPQSFLPRYVSMLEVVACLDSQDRLRPYDAPHKALLWNGAVWYPFKT